MQDIEHIKYYAIALSLVWLFVVFLFIRTCEKFDDQIIKELEDDHNENIKATLLDYNDLSEEELGILLSEYPTVDGYQSLN